MTGDSSEQNINSFFSAPILGSVLNMTTEISPSARHKRTLNFSRLKEKRQERKNEGGIAGGKREGRRKREE